MSPLGSVILEALCVDPAFVYWNLLLCYINPQAVCLFEGYILKPLLELILTGIILLFCRKSYRVPWISILPRLLESVRLQ